jgi:hypothetical protein
VSPFPSQANPFITKGADSIPFREAALRPTILDWETEEHYWISGCKKRGGDRLYAGTIEIDDDVREEYWNEIRELPDRKGQKLIRCAGKYR